jgi:cytochrome P450
MNNNASKAAQSTGLLPLSFFSKDVAVSHPFPLLTQLRLAGAVVPVPAPLYEQLRAEGTVRAPLLSPSSVWIVTRFAEAVQLLKSPLFTVNPSSLRKSNDRLPTPDSAKSGLGGLFAHSMVAVDGRDHQRLRGLVSKAFTPRYIQGLRPTIQQIADELLDRIQDHGHMDLVNAYAFPLSIQVISTMLGFPVEGQVLARDWSDVINGRASERQDPSRASIFPEYLVQLIAEKRAHPQDDLISQLVQMEEGGDRLNEQELLSTIALLIFAGHATTSNLISTAMLILFDAPTQLQRLKADLQLVPTAVEEVLRYSSPVLLSPFPHYATEDVTLGGQQIRQGDLVLVALGSANRDESQFTQPEELDIARRLNHHLAFGQGIHMCLGAALARLEGDIALTTLLRRLPDVRLALPRDEVIWRGHLPLREISSLPVAFSSVRDEGKTTLE